VKFVSRSSPVKHLSGQGPVTERSSTALRPESGVGLTWWSGAGGVGLWLRRWRSSVVRVSCPACWAGWAGLRAWCWWWGTPGWARPGLPRRAWPGPRPMGWTVHRPWCRSCCQELDRDHRDVIRFPTWQDANTAPRKGRAGAPRHGEDRTDQHASAPMEPAATAGQDVDLPATTTGRSSNLNRNLLEHNLPACRVPGGRL
jgi:hypothetical protein